MGSLSFGRTFWSIVLLLLLAGPIFGLGVYRIVGRSEDAHTQGRFDEVVNESAYLLEKQLIAFSEVLSAVEALFASSESVSREDFAVFTRSALARHGCIRALEWIPLVPIEARASHERSARDEGFTDYRIRDLNASSGSVPDRLNNAHFPVFYVEPYAGNEAALGLDLASETARHRAIRQALASQEPVLSDPVDLAQSDGQSPGILLFQRVGNDAGLVLLVFEVATLVNMSITSGSFHDPLCYDFVLEDFDTSVGAVVLHRHGNGNPTPNPDRWRTSKMIETGGKHWRLTAVPTETFMAQNRRMAGFVGVGSTVLWELLFVTLIMAASGAKTRIQRRQGRLTYSVLAGMTEGVVVADAAGRIVMTNQAADQMLKAPLKGDLRPPFRHPNGSAACTPDECPLNRAVAGDSAKEQIFCIHDDTSGTNTWLTVNGKPLRNSKGELTGGLIVMRDISDTKRSDEVVEKLFNAVELTDDAVFITTRDGRIEYINPAFTRVTGYTKREVIGKTPRLLKSDNHPPEHYRELWSTVLSGKVYRNTITNRRKNGEIFTADQTITPMRDITGRISNFVSVSKDMTEFLALQERELHMTVAANVQKRLYPQTSPLIHGLDLAGAVFPAGQTCGDYYDYIEMPDGNLGIVVGDVSGHGIGAAMVMMETRAMLRTLIEAEWSVEDAFARINKALYEDLDAGSFVTMIFATLDPSTGHLTYVSAGHDTCFVLDASGALKYEMHSTGMPLGLVKGSTSGTGIGPTLDDGDVAVLVTDGLTECQAHRGRFLEKDTCLDAIRARLHEPASEILGGLHTLVRDFSGDDPQIDDITIVVCKVGTSGQEDIPTREDEMRMAN